MSILGKSSTRAKIYTVHVFQKSAGKKNKATILTSLSGKKGSFRGIVLIKTSILLNILEIKIKNVLR